MKTATSTAGYCMTVVFALAMFHPWHAAPPIGERPLSPPYQDPYPEPTTPPTPELPSLFYNMFLPLIYRGTPFEDFSYYVASGSDLHELGRRRALSYSCSSGPIESLAIFSFGNALGDNAVYSFEQINLGLPGVKARVENFVIGFYNEIVQRGCQVQLTIAVGINASVTPSVAHGQNWGNMIDELNNSMIINGYSEHVYIVGAIDIEPEWIAPPYFVDPQDVIGWVNGYSGATSTRAYNFGSAVNCPTDYPPTYPEFQNVTAQECYSSYWTPNKWTQEEVYWVSRGRMRPLPQNYNIYALNADQWYRVGLYSKLKHEVILEFHGSLTQYYACKQEECSSDTQNHPREGYNQLYNALYDPFGRIDRPMYYMTDILWYNGDPWCLFPGDRYCS